MPQIQDTGVHFTKDLVIGVVLEDAWAFTTQGNEERKCGWTEKQPG